MLRGVRPLAKRLALLIAGSLVTGAASAPPSDALDGAHAVRLSGSVFLDANANGRRDPGEPGVAGARVSDQAHTVVSGPDGAWAIAASRGHGVVFVAAPAGYRARSPFWRPQPAAGGPLDFALERQAAVSGFWFIHASDTHASQASADRIHALRALVDERRPAFVLVTGDLVKDALRVGEAEAASYFDLYVGETARFPVPVWSVPGNHDNFGIERAKSGVDASHPLYGKRMYRQRLGPNYYSFDHGGVHFVALDTVDVDDQWYYGHVDEEQLAWLEGDLAAVAPGTPVVTFNHIPFVSAVEPLAGYRDDPPAPTLIEVGDKTQFRHVVSNLGEVLARFGRHPLVLALGGHMHARESIRYEAEGKEVRFEQAAAVVGPSEAGSLHMRSGVTLYRVQDGGIDAGTFLPLEAARP
jgi:predicted MPP superfamily phosphohydrolase